MPMETTGLTEIAAKCDAFPVELKYLLTPAATEGAELVAETAKSNASFSSKIPGQIDATGAVFGTFGVGAEVRVHGGEYPHVAEARVMEGDGYGGEFRHPVYGNADAWVSQESHPFLQPAVDARRGAVVDLIQAAVRKALTL